MAKSMRPYRPPRKPFRCICPQTVEVTAVKNLPLVTLGWAVAFSCGVPLRVASLSAPPSFIFFKRSLLSFQDVTPAARGFVTCCRLFFTSQRPQLLMAAGGKNTLEEERILKNTATSLECHISAGESFASFPRCSSDVA